jgi:hypothetical protein
MELVHGETLHARLARGPLPPDEIVRLGRQLADALAHAHAHGVIHRDLKSANIVLTPEGRAKVLDFGLAKRVTHDAGAETMTGAQTVAQPGMIAGTLAYMAPEQLRGQPADARSDVWALGVVLHQMATGTLPFPGDTAYEVSAAILHEPPMPLPETVPGALRAVIAHCLDKDPAHRHADGASVQRALDALATGQPAPATGPLAPHLPARLTRAGRTRLMATLGALALLVVGSALITLDVRVPPHTLRRFWMMLAHYHGQTFNASEIAASLGVADTTASRYLDVLAGTLMVRRLAPWFENIGKRQVKAPRVLFRDSGIYHRLLGIPDRQVLYTHPKLGPSWEGMAIEQLIRASGASDEEVCFWGRPWPGRHRPVGLQGRSTTRI